ncbi:MAG: DNA polymerase IV [Agarilytica sp.]
MKKIIHIDADCFFAAVEMRDNPSFISLPIAVGGSPDSRGVIATCNYEARKFGVHSAMPSAHAVKLCPFLKILPPRMSVYREYSQAMRSIFSQYTDLIEPLSLDEAYLDVTGSDNLKGSATLIARHIRNQVKSEIGISVSAGVAPVKFLAKIASDWKKPDGLFVVEPSMVESFVRPLSVKKLPGVGPVTAEKLARYGIYTCDELNACGLERLVRLFGTFGPKLFNMARGEDDRAVQPFSERKSISVEKTFTEDVGKLAGLFPRLGGLLTELIARIEKAKAKDKISKAFVKLKFNDFSVTTMEASFLHLKQPEAEDIYGRLLSTAWQRKKMPVRLLGVGVRLANDSPNQLSLALDED